MQKTEIEYLTHTWNPIAMRCTPVSSGCDNCWHLRMANRMAGMGVHSDEDGDGPYSNRSPILKTKSSIMGRDELSAPLRRKKPSVIGVQFMGDLFHENVTNEMIAAVFGVMAACPKHTFIVLTKRPERAMKWFEWVSEYGQEIPSLIGEDIPHGKFAETAACVMSVTTENEALEPLIYCSSLNKPWPLLNVWFGVSIEDQKTADERIPLLLQIPAAKRFVSAEPLLEKVDLCDTGGSDFVWCNSCVSWNCELHGMPPNAICTQTIDWVICGAETGPGKRLMDIEWARSLRDQCAEANVPFFFKKDSDGSHTLDGVIHEEMP